MGERPLAALSAAAAAGAWIGVESGNLCWAAALFGLGLLALWGGWTKGRTRARFEQLRKLGPLLLIAALGAWRGARVDRAVRDPALESWLSDGEAALRGREPILLEARVEERALLGDGARLTLLIEQREAKPGAPLEEAPAGLRAELDGPRWLHRGDRVRALARLHLPEPQRNPGGRDRRAELAREGISLAGSLDEADVSRTAAGPRFFRALDELRDRFSHRCAELAETPDRAALLSALGVGDRAGLSSEAGAALEDSGLVHLLSSAGLHLALAALLAWKFFRALLLALPWTRRSRTRAWAGLLALPVVLAEVLLLGAPWPAIRAGVAASLALLAPLASRRFDGLTGLLLGVAVCALWDPASIAGVSLPLSLAGVLGLILLAPRLREMIPLRPPPPGAAWRQHPLWLAREETLRLFCASAAASLCTAPLMASAFHRISIVSALANAIGLWPGLAALPIASLAVPFNPLSPQLALPLFWAGDRLCALVLLCARGFSQLPGAAVQLSAPGPLAWLLWLAALLLLAGFPAPFTGRANPLRARPRTLLLRASIPLALLALISLAREAHAHASGKLTATFLSVGQGDAALLQFPDGSTMLIDGGGDLRDLPAPEGKARLDPGARDVLPALAELGVTRIDRMVLSHPHPDHAGGLFAVLRAMPVGELWITGEPGPGDIGGKLRRAAEKAGVPVHVPKPGEIWERGGASVEVLAPDPVWDPARETNDNSILLRVVHGQVALLLAGDAEALEELQLAQGPRSLRADLLKAGHHGSRTSTTDAFLRAVQPRFVVFSEGAQNPFGFPHREVVARVEALGAKAFRTDAGAVIAESDGTRLRVRSFSAGPSPP